MIKQFYLTDGWDPNGVLPFWVRVELEVMPMKEYLKVPGLEPHHQMPFSIMSRHWLEAGVLHMSRGAIGVLYSSSRLDCVRIRKKTDLIIKML